MSYLESTEQQPELAPDNVSADQPKQQASANVTDAFQEPDNNDTVSVIADESSNMPIQRNSTSLIYALGLVHVVFPNKGLEKQFLAAARALGVNEKNYYAVFTNNNSTSEPDKYLYLAEQVDWVLSIESERVYVLTPASKSELTALINTLKPPADTLEQVYTCVIGNAYWQDNSLGLEAVLCQQVYSHTMSELHDTIKNISTAETNAIQDVIKSLELAPNKGRSNDDRAKNFIAFRYPDIYAHTHSMQTGSASGKSASLIKIGFTQFDASSEHSIVDITFTYQENSSEKKHSYFCRVDVSGLYPFINTAIQPFTPIQPRL
ncbi:hypothetical protein [Pseudoalteromonas sp. MMG024]|uniref:cyanobactin maturation protease PatG family protein n=1 Tax=Pseudoalteromonas sp. MMG024 TaxID=2909980 RepID=UPI001F3CFAC5|nr:hypothetical protein [Pseudoalteromonas sp. MMG024]MCF6459119.1 hypothetical protein [Pseudoalteromonas sp. MMG024]